MKPEYSLVAHPVGVERPNGLKSARILANAKVLGYA
jgi:hypothetical protein